MNKFKEYFERTHYKQFPIHKPYMELTKSELDILWNGSYGINEFFKMLEKESYKIQYTIRSGW